MRRRYHILLPLDGRRAFVHLLGATVRAVARRRRRGWLEARQWVQGRCGLDLRGWHALSRGDVARVPRVALERLERIRMEASA